MHSFHEFKNNMDCIQPLVIIKDIEQTKICPGSSLLAKASVIQLIKLPFIGFIVEGSQ